MAQSFMYDAFITYSSMDALYAEQLYALLSVIGHKVFLDSEALIGGDSWPKVIRQAQQDSLLTLILISDRVDSAYFQQEEILSAIAIAREDHRRRVVPLYLMGKRKRTVIRDPLKQLHGIYWEEGSSLLSVAQKIEAALKASKRPQGWPDEIVLDTVVIVTGCYHRAEIFDRPSAYELRTSIDYIGGSVGRAFLHSLVMGDIWFKDHSHITGHPNVISIGAPGINSLSEIIDKQGKPVRKDTDGRWRIMRAGNRWALIGDQAEDTNDAVSSFKERDLQGFLGQIWSHLLTVGF